MTSLSSQMMAALLLLPLAGAGAIAVAPRQLAKHIGVITSLAVFALSIVLAWDFPEWHTGRFWPDNAAGAAGAASGPVGGAGGQFILGISLTLGVDSVSMLLILLTTFLTPLALLGSYTSVVNREREFYGWFLILLSAMLLAFMARDVIAFYIGYEFTIVPMLFLIAIFGGDNRRYASIKFFVFTFVASVITLSGLIYVAAARAHDGQEWSFALADLQSYARSDAFSETQRYWVFVAMMIGFCVKVPFFPVHSWLPLAHDQAPTGGSVILAGTLLKLGTYGIYRVALPMAPDAAVEVAPLLVTFCVIAIVAISLVCVAQKDVKRLVAYSSVSHMGVAMLGMLALNPVGVSGSVLYMINHGLSTGALFLCIGMMYERYHTKEMDKLGGLAKKMPVWAFFMIFFTMTSVGLPGLNGFVSEVMCLLGAFNARPSTAIDWPGVIGPRWMLIAGVGSVIFGALYMLYMVGRVVWGPLKEPGHGHGHEGGHGGSHGHSHGHAAAGGHDHAASGHEHRSLPTDLCTREVLTLAPIAILCLFLGLQPKYVLDAIGPSAMHTIAGYPEAVKSYLERKQADDALAGKAVSPATTTDPTAVTPTGVTPTAVSPAVVSVGTIR